MTPAVELKDVRFAQRRAAILSDVTLSIGGGEILALFGPSGSGKSTLIRIILGLAAPDAGVVRISGRAVSEPRRIVVPPEERGLGVVFQDLALWPHLTAAGHLDFGLAANGIAKPERRRRIAAMLESVGLTDKAGRCPGELSGGERQRVAIARALVLEPRVVLLDEPLSNLDVALKADLLRLFHRLIRERGATALYVTHDPREAVGFADRVAVLEAGRVVRSGTLAEVLAVSSPAHAEEDP